MIVMVCVRHRNQIELNTARVRHERCRINIVACSRIAPAEEGRLRVEPGRLFGIPGMTAPPLRSHLVEEPSV
jgi:hypothetical protein